MRRTSGTRPRRSNHQQQDQSARERRAPTRAGRTRLTTTALVALVALALFGAAGCTEDTDSSGRTLPSGQRPLELSDVRLVSATTCDDLVARAEEREQAIRDQVEYWNEASQFDDVDGAVTASGGSDAATSSDEATSSDKAAPAAGPVTDIPATTAAPMPSAAADADGGGTGQEREAGGTVIAGTNNQEQGVDEGDLAKTDGKVLVTLSTDGTLRAVVLDDSPQVDGVLALDEPGTPSGSSYGLSGQLMLRRTPSGGSEVVAVRASYSDQSGIPLVDIARIDLTDPTAPALTERARVAGELVATRMIDGVGRIVIRPALGTALVEPVPVPTTSAPTTTTEAPAPSTTEPGTSTTTSSTTTTTSPATTEPSDSEPSDIPAAAAALLPQRLTAAGRTEALGGCDDVLSIPATSPIDPTGGATVDMAYPTTSGVTVLTVGATLGDLAPVTVEGGAETVYAGTDALYTTATTWSPTPTGGDSLTAVHRFDLTGEGPARYTGSGLIPGRLLNQYSMSDRSGELRVVTTAQTPVPQSQTPGSGKIVPDDAVVDIAPSSTTAGRITVLRPDDDGTLREVGHLDDLGRGEEVKSVRFVEDRAYVVTFRQTDPLFALDMSNDTPVLLGELKIPGFSEYLHPVGDGQLLGIGSDADPQTGQVTGFKASLFDVSDPTDPVELDSFTEANATSLVGQDPHAFTWDPVRSQAILPITIQPSFDRSRPPEAMPLPSTTPTIPACPPGADCGSGSSGISVDEPYRAPWSGAWVIGVDGDRLVRRGTLTHDLGGSTDQILRSLVVDSSIWTVSDRAVGRSDATAPTATALIRF